MEAASSDDLVCFFYAASIDTEKSIRGMIQKSTFNNAKEKVTGWIWVSEMKGRTFCVQYIEGKSKAMDVLCSEIEEDCNILEVYAKGSIRSKLFGNWSMFSMRSHSEILKENEELVMAQMATRFSPKIMDSFKQFVTQNSTELSEMCSMENDEWQGLPDE